MSHAASWERRLVAGLVVAVTCSAYSATAQDEHPFQQAMHTGSMLTGAILQDQTGFIWIGSQGAGLLRFDAYEIKRFLAGPESIADDNVFAVYEDREGLIWIGTAGGLSSYDKGTDAFQTYTASDSPRGPVGDVFNVSLQTIVQDRSGAIWTGSTKGLSRLDKGTGRFSHFTHSADDPKSLDSSDIVSILEDAAGALWVGTKAGLNRFDPATQSCVRFAHDPDDPKSLPGGAVYALLQARNGALWIGTERGLARLDSGGASFTRFGKASGIPNDFVYTIFERPDGSLWLTHLFKGGGITVFDVSAGLFSSLGNDPKQDGPLSGPNVANIYEGKGGAVWVPNLSGAVDRFDPRAHRIKSYPHDPTDPTTIGDVLINTSYEDRDGTMWFGAGNGLNRLDRSTGLFTRYQTGDASGIPGSFVCGPLDDWEGNLWVLSGKHISLFDRAAGRCSASFPTIVTPITVIEDSTDPSRLWICSFGNGLGSFDKKTRQTTIFAHDAADPGSISNDIMAQIVQDDAGFIWLPTWGGGLDQFDPRTGRVVARFRHDPKDPTSIGSDTVVNAYIDSRKRMWLGTYGGGLNLMDRSSGTFQRFNAASGFPSDTVTNVLEDDQGHLWLGTKIGFVRFNPESHKTRVLTTADGMAGNEFQEGSMCKSRDGAVWAVTITGASSFVPSELKENTAIPPVVLTSLTQGGEELELGKAFDQVKRLELDWQQDFFEFEFAALNFTRPEKNRYKYMLEGIDEEWYDSGSRRFGRYTNLPSGSYTLRIIGSNNDGLWNTEGVSVDIRVVPPFWQETWFRAVGASSILVFLAAILGLRTRNATRQRQLLEAQVQERTEQLELATAEAKRANLAKSEFLTRMSHELRTPLNSIMGYAQLLQRESLPEKVGAGLETIHGSGEHLLTLINDILDLSKIEASRLELSPTPFSIADLLKGVIGIASIRAQDQGVTVHCDSRPPLPATVLADEKRLRQVLLNLVNNGIKFTPEGEVRLVARALEEGAESSKTVRVRFEVTDTGVGIEPDHVDTIFLPFERVGGAQSEIEGTGLGLAISRNIVSLLGGELHVQSTLGEGSSFWFDLDLLPTDEAPARTGRVNVVPSYRGEPKTILLVDDIAQNREILESFLKPVGFRVEQAESGEQALKAVEDLAPDLIFLDLMMPRMSGYETLAKLSELPRFGRTPVIATSASVFEEERAKSQDAGFADFLPKPVRSEALFSIVAKQLGLDWEESADASPKPSQSALELPSAEELGSLLEFARKGDLERVAREAQLLAAADARYNPFAALVARLARDFETGRTIALLTPKPAKESS